MPDKKTKKVMRNYLIFSESKILLGDKGNKMNIGEINKIQENSDDVKNKQDQNLSEIQEEEKLSKLKNL